MDSNFMCQLGKLYVLPDSMKEKGYSLNHAIYTAMSMDYTYWRTLMTLQAGLKKEDDAHTMIEMKRTTFFVEDVVGGVYRSSALNQSKTNMMMERVWKYNREMKNASPCFHAKLIILKYTAKDLQDYYRIGILSKNLTEDRDCQNICVVAGTVGDTETDNGLRLWVYLNHCKSYCTLRWAKNQPATSADVSMMESIQRLQLPENCEIYFNGLGQDGIRDSKNPDKCCLWDVLGADLSDDCGTDHSLYAVSKARFIGDRFRDIAMCSNCNRIIEEGECSFRRNFSGPGGKKSLHLYSCYDKETKQDSTHMKIYLKYCGNSLYEYWSGSANCSEAALGRNPVTGTKSKGQNIECLVRVGGLSNTDKDNFITAITQDNNGSPSDFPVHRRLTGIYDFPPHFEPNDDRQLKILALEKVKEAYTFRWVKDERRKSDPWYIKAESVPQKEESAKKTVDEPWKITYDGSCRSGKVGYKDIEWDWTVSPQSCFKTMRKDIAKHPTVSAPEYGEIVLWGCSGTKAEQRLIICPEGFTPKTGDEVFSSNSEIARQIERDFWNCTWVSKLLKEDAQDKREEIFKAAQSACERLVYLKTELGLGDGEKERRAFEDIKYVFDELKKTKRGTEDDRESTGELSGTEL